ncbi:MAG: hypothetical protein VX294_11380 [Candidatus Latescibacterota bacterium]|nr:hypothetical protein [Candidatus Latescibacterota bacterium]
MKKRLWLILTSHVILSVGCDGDKGTNAEHWSPPDHSEVEINNLRGNLVGSMCMGCPLIIFDVVTGNHHQLTEEVGTEPSWSYDGEQLVYVSINTRDSEYKPTIYTANNNGMSITKIIENGGSPALSFNGKYIAFIGYNDNATTNLVVMDMSTQAQDLLSENARWPSWKPNGTQLAYSQVNVGENGTDVSQLQSYIVDITNRKTEPLVRGLTPIWSPNGKKLAFIRTAMTRIVEKDAQSEMGPGMGNGIDIYIANTDGVDEELLYQSQQSIAALLFGLEAIHGWSQDSQELLITVMNNRLSPGCGEDVDRQPAEDFVSTPDCYKISDTELHLIDIESGKTTMVSDKIVNPAWYSE